MSASKGERDHILQMVEAGDVTAAQAAQLLDALESERDYLDQQPTQRRRERTLRIRATSMKTRPQKMNISASLPVSLLKIGLHLSAQLLPQLGQGQIQDLLRAIESGASGRVLDLQDLEQGERLEIFVE
jgi:DNA-binding transcriptional LysR family regulator